MVAKSPPPSHDLEERLRELRRAAESGDRERVLQAIQHIVPTYRRTPGQEPIILAASQPEIVEQPLASVVYLRNSVGGAREVN